MAVEITEALTLLKNDEDVELVDIEPRVRAAMEAVGDLAPDDAVEMRPLLVSLLEKMEEFSLILQDKINEINTEEDNALTEESDENN